MEGRCSRFSLKPSAQFSGEQDMGTISGLSVDTHLNRHRTALAFLAVVVLTVADEAQENPGIAAKATPAIPTPAPTLQPKPERVRKYTDQQLKHWAATDASYVWNESDIQLDPNHHFNWFEIGVKMGTATKFLVHRYGFNEADGKAYKEFFNKAFMGIAMAEQNGQLSL
jgi:hypothetical protein